MLQEMNRSEDEEEEDVEVLGEGCMSPEAIAEAERAFEQQYGLSTGEGGGLHHGAGAKQLRQIWQGLWNESKGLEQRKMQSRMYFPCTHTSPYTNTCSK